MATGALNANGIWIYGEDDNEPTFSGVLNKLASSTSTQINSLRHSGRVLKVISTTKTDTFSSTSSSLVDVTGLSVTITPTSTTSKVLVTVNTYVSNSDAGWGVDVALLRGATKIALNSGGIYSATPYTASNQSGGTLALTFLDSPATTSATTYKLQMKVGGGTGHFGRYAASASLPTVSSITVMEVAG